MRPWQRTTPPSSIPWPERRGIGGRGAAHGWDDAVPAGTNHAAQAGSSTRSLPGRREAEPSAVDSTALSYRAVLLPVRRPMLYMIGRAHV